MDKIEKVAFAIEFGDESKIPPEFLHLYPIKIRLEHEEFDQIFAKVCLNKVRLGFGHDIQKLFNEPNLSFKLYFKKYVDGLETILSYFAPESIREWYHHYGINLLRDAMGVFFQRIDSQKIFISSMRKNDENEGSFMTQIISEINEHLTDIFVEIIELRVSSAEKQNFQKLKSKNIFGVQVSNQEEEKVRELHKKL